MEAVLRERGLLTPGVAAELAAGRRYWREERRLCSLMRRHPAVPPGGHEAACGFTLAEALSASGAKVGGVGAELLLMLSVPLAALPEPVLCWATISHLRAACPSPSRPLAVV